MGKNRWRGRVRENRCKIKSVGNILLNNANTVVLYSYIYVYSVLNAFIVNEFCTVNNQCSFHDGTFEVFVKN